MEDLEIVDRVFRKRFRCQTSGPAKLTISQKGLKERLGNENERVLDVSKPGAQMQSMPSFDCQQTLI